MIYLDYSELRLDKKVPINVNNSAYGFPSSIESSSVRVRDVKHIPTNRKYGTCSLSSCRAYFNALLLVNTNNVGGVSSPADSHSKDQDGGLVKNVRLQPTNHIASTFAKHESLVVVNSEPLNPAHPSLSHEKYVTLFVCRFMPAHACL